MHNVRRVHTHKQFNKERVEERIEVGIIVHTSFIMNSRHFASLINVTLYSLNLQRVIL